ncbi:hypothetical protein BKA70DRAFT_1263158 [Coprinopsis sp. MPI-PUGE-AT-0042]|nr:hypothetical protein BKA70DRAFT_1263158 [Coprinopsis sp. MPI-PUGE-AT-0042]
MRQKWSWSRTPKASRLLLWTPFSFCCSLHVLSEMPFSKEPSSDADRNTIQETFWGFRRAGVERWSSYQSSPIAINLVLADKVDFVPEDDGIYGLGITNSTPWNLYFYCLYFYSMDLSISALTRPLTWDFMVPRKGGTASIGYGPLATPPISFDPVPRGLDASAGFFKLYYAGDPLNIPYVPQGTHFDDVRPSGRGVPSVWGIITLLVIQRRAKS